MEDVEASLQDSRLQAAHDLSELDEKLRHQLRARREEVLEEGASESTQWIYFSSPDWTWEQLCGREGWLLYDPKSKHQHGFLMTLMN